MSDPTCCHRDCGKPATYKVSVWIPDGSGGVRAIETYSCEECSQLPGVTVIWKFEPTNEGESDGE